MRLFTRKPKPQFRVGDIVRPYPVGMFPVCEIVGRKWSESRLDATCAEGHWEYTLRGVTSFCDRTCADCHMEAVSPEEVLASPLTDWGAIEGTG